MGSAATSVIFWRGKRKGHCDQRNDVDRFITDREGLGQSAVEVSVATIDDEVLRGGVARLFGREKEDGHGGDFSSFGHAMAEGDSFGDGFEGRGGIFSGFEPALVERGQDFGGKDAVDANVEGEKFGGPLTRECELSSLRRGIG